MACIDNFIDSLQQSHLDNAQRVYVAKTLGMNGRESEMSPLANFVFEFFIFNSLYAVDWQATFSSGSIIHHSRDMTETKMQREFVKFCRRRCQDLSILTQSFLPLCGLNDIGGHWTQVTPDDRIGIDDGQKFFADVAALGQLARNETLTTTKATFDRIDDCCYFVYLVRNNIFHGSKSLGEVNDPAQARRIGVYDLFVRCLNSLFFLTCGRKQHGAGFAQLPIVQAWNGSLIEFPLQDVFRLLRCGLLKPEDSALHWRLFRSHDHVPSLQPHDRRALFYPSSGDDLLFPLVIGMPYCTDFFFYEQSNRFLRRGRGRSIIGQLVGRDEVQDTAIPEEECYEFEFAAVRRHVWIMRKDNMTFLEQDVPLAFYFHRGDSEGEGGSGQLWDSNLLPKVLAKAMPEYGCRILTDGQPGGVVDHIQSAIQRISLVNSHRGRDYFYGVVQAK